MGERILLVEGKDDQHVMWNLFEQRKIPEQFRVEYPKSDDAWDDSGGVDRLLESIPARLVQAGLERLAVVVDANEKGPAARWQSLRDRFSNAGYAESDLPRQHSPNGTTFDLSLQPQTPRSIRCAVWIMPDNRSQGMLEDFVAALIREDDDMLPYVGGFLDSIPSQQRRFVPAHHSKARIHAWLAVSERPGRPMGQAIKADRHLDANAPSVQPFLDWIKDSLTD